MSRTRNRSSDAANSGRYLGLEVGAFLPDVFHPERAHSVPDELIGARIVRFGAAPSGSDIEGGGLIIDFMPRGSKQVRRAVFCFTELGMWLDYLGDGPSVTC